MQTHLVQYNIAWHQALLNFNTVTALTENIKGGLIVLPEMFSTGFTMEPEKVAEAMEGPSFTFLKQ